MSRPPYLSVSMPAGIRPTDPTRIGSATSSDFCALDNPSSSV
jgi:hypothetical protein